MILHSPFARTWRETYPKLHRTNSEDLKERLQKAKGINRPFAFQKNLRSWNLVTKKALKKHKKSQASWKVLGMFLLNCARRFWAAVISHFSFSISASVQGAATKTASRGKRMASKALNRGFGPEQAGLLGFGLDKQLQMGLLWRSSRSQIGSGLHKAVVFLQVIPKHQNWDWAKLSQETKRQSKDQRQETILARY